MKGILDIIVSETAEGESDFTADSAELDVLVNPPSVNGLTMFNANSAKTFQSGDNLLIRKIWCVIPWGFGQGASAEPPFPHRVEFSYWNGSLNVPLPCFAGNVLYPSLCDVLDFGDGISCPMTTDGAGREIRLTGIELRVSQINIPSALDGMVIPVQYYMEVLHTYPMIGV